MSKANGPLITIQAPNEVFGGDAFSLTVEVLNIGNLILKDVTIKDCLLPGIELRNRSPEGSSGLSVLNQRRDRILEEMFTQCEFCFLFHSAPSNVFSKLLRKLELSSFSFLKIVSSKLGPKHYLTMLPAWSRQALLLRDIDDAKEAHGRFIEKLPDDHEIRIAWDLNMSKLERLQSTLEKAKGEAGRGEIPEQNLDIGGTTAITFNLRAPRPLSVKDLDAVIEVSYREGDSSEIQVATQREKIRVFASPISVIFGAALGAILGFFIRTTYVTPVANWLDLTSLKDLTAAIMLGMLFAVLTRKTRNSKKPITADDFFGGVLVGAIAGIFTEKTIAAFSGVLR